jgi:hypothetical protein
MRDTIEIMNGKNMASNAQDDTKQIRQRFVRAQSDVYKVTADIPKEEIEAIVAAAVAESRRERSGNQ